MSAAPRIFAISPRTPDVDGYWTDICKVAAFSEKCGLTGVLLFRRHRNNLFLFRLLPNVTENW
jgi:hypothetical protein